MALHLRPVVGFAPPNGDDDVSRNAVLCLDCRERGLVGCQVPATCVGQSGKLRLWQMAAGSFMNSACSFGRRPGRARSGRLRSSCTPVRASSNVALKTPCFWASTQSSWSQRLKSASARAGAPSARTAAATASPKPDFRRAIHALRFEHLIGNIKSVIVLAFIFILAPSALPSHFTSAELKRSLVPSGFPMSDMEDFIDVKVTRRGREVAELFQIAGDDRSRRAQFGTHRSLSTGYDDLA